MSTRYHQRLIPVIRHLEKNYMSPLNLQELATIANLSAFHFHRVFSAVTGETPKEMIRRLRLENAALDLYCTNRSVTEVALDYGFSSSQSLAKAFRQYYALTPSAIRDCQNYEQLKAILQNSKIGHTLRKSGHADSPVALHNADETSQRSHLIMETCHFEPGKLAYIRVTGPYGEGYDVATNQLYQWAGAKGLQECTCIFIYHDNPEITPAEKCRTDVCLMVPEGTDVSGPVELQDFPGGSYAVVRETITDQSQYGQVWQSLVDQVVNSQMEMDDRPCFELYHSYDKQNNHADVSFCNAVKV
ncbi:GyrI-like domain-containing protein [Corallincola platygyrae]|uniref:GyrI-like domain-containing protein n=1 Tax=Corallincola platygyrae TaxID=1193278 RepID=A0ABW4XNU5_9GAMM